MDVHVRRIPAFITNQSTDKDVHRTNSRDSNMALALGLDLGTTSVSAVAVDARGRLAGRVVRTHHADLPSAGPGRDEQSPEVLWKTACAVLLELASQLPEKPDCLGVTGQMHGMLLVDEGLVPQGPLVTWRDRRALEAGPSGSTPLETFRASCSPAAVQRTGCTPSPGYQAVTLSALITMGEFPKSARSVLVPADWVAARLAGALPRTDRTNAASTGVYDLERDEWSELMEQTGLPREYFPPVVESGAQIGGLSGSLAAEIGLPAGLPVSTPIGDHQAALLGSLPAAGSAIHVNVGTGGQISIPLERFLRAPGSDTRYLPEDRFILVGAGLAGGDAYAWVRDRFADWLAAAGVSVSGPDIYRILNQAVAAMPPGAAGLVAEPFFRGTRRDPERRGLIRGVSTTNFSVGHLGRAVLDGIAGAFAEFHAAHTAQLPDAPGGDRLIATGNAVRENSELARSLAAAFGREVWTTTHREEAAFGAAMLAGVRAGLWSDLADAAGRLEWSRIA